MVRPWFRDVRLRCICFESILSVWLFTYHQFHINLLWKIIYDTTKFMHDSFNTHCFQNVPSKIYRTLWILQGI